MRYESNASGRDKEYVVHPYRLVHAQSGLYLQAYVPAYGEIRTFLLNRIKRLTVEEGGFQRVAELSTEPFGKSLGAFSGPSVAVKLRFAPRIAGHIRDRVWHDSQQLKDRPDGSVVMTLQVCDDYALRQWILGFGPNVRVLSPASLVGWIIDQLDTSREQYETGAFAVDSEAQPALPFLFGQIAGA
jgi:predicted DNA-binding transcriptional regulator YafY